MRYIKCTACGANRPIAVKASPVTAKRPATQASAIMPVMMVADASTMPIWNAADAIFVSDGTRASELSRAFPRPSWRAPPAACEPSLVSGSSSGSAADGLLPEVDHASPAEALNGRVAHLSRPCKSGMFSMPPCDHGGRRMLLAWKNAHRLEASIFLTQRVGLRALAQRLRERQKQRDHRDQQCDPFLLERGPGMLGGALPRAPCFHAAPMRVSP